jgi:hypothetical protein
MDAKERSAADDVAYSLLVTQVEKFSGITGFYPQVSRGYTNSWPRLSHDADVAATAESGQRFVAALLALTKIGEPDRTNRGWVGHSEANIVEAD